MEYKTIDNKVMFRLDPGEELVSSIKTICESEHICLGTVNGLGATNDITIGLFELKTKKYHQKHLQGDHEIAPLYGNITQMDGKVYLHLHINICDESNQSYCGHLNKAIISVTFEGVIEGIQGVVNRKKDSKTGLNILSF